MLRLNDDIWIGRPEERATRKGEARSHGSKSEVNVEDE